MGLLKTKNNLYGVIYVYNFLEVWKFGVFLQGESFLRPLFKDPGPLSSPPFAAENPLAAQPYGE